MPEPLSRPVGADDHVRGEPGAPFELVMYGDFQCPYCIAAQSVLRRVQERLGDRLRFVFRHFPIVAKHPDAFVAAEAAEAAAAQDAFWPMHDRLFAARAVLDAKSLRRYARDAGLDVNRFERDLAEHVHAERVQRDIDDGVRSGVTGTPAFFVNGIAHGVAFDARSLVEALERG
jgi:protein-disulfide isomerase